MSNSIQDVTTQLLMSPKRWLVTGGAGFIGSNIAEFLLTTKQDVTVLDNLSSGHIENVNFLESVAKKHNASFKFVHGDITDYKTCLMATSNMDYISHQAAVGSVPRSIERPLDSHINNVDGTLNIFLAAKESNIKRIVYASSSSVYGDSLELPKQENKIGTPLSPYAITKLINEIYAKNFSQIYQMDTIGLRYFNVFGPRQDPNGAYAAVIPRWIKSLVDNKPVVIFGDGETSRDFCFIKNVVQMNILAATTEDQKAINQVYNVACAEATSLKQLYQIIVTHLSDHYPHVKNLDITYEDFRSGDIRHSLADISKAEELLKYKHTHTISKGMSEYIPWYVKQL